MADAPDDASGWLGRVDALADRLAGLEDRGSIVDQVVSETMKLLPADEVVVRADAAAVTMASFTDASDGVPARAVIPLVIGGRHFGAVEIAMKSRRAVLPAERTLSIALARQCALALDGLAMRSAQRETARPVPTDREAVDAPAETVALVPLASVEPALITDGRVSAAPGESTAPSSPSSSSSQSPASSRDHAAEQALLVRLGGDLRGLAKLARSAELPPTSWVDRAEQAALRRLEELRAQLAGPTDAS